MLVNSHHVYDYCVFHAGIHTSASPVQDKSNQARREFRRQEQRGSAWEVLDNVMVVWQGISMGLEGKVFKRGGG